MKFSIVPTVSAAPRFLASIILTIALSACATQPQALWLKPGAATEEFGQDKYGCMQQSQQPNSVAYANRYGGVANSSIITNGPLYDACMNSKGWVLTAVTDVKGYSEAMRPIGEESRAMCSREEFQALYRKKMSCKAIDTTPEQIADRSKVSGDEKAAFAKWFEVVQPLNEKVASINRQFNPKTGDAVAVAVENGWLETRKLAGELVSSTISWGEYNRRRVDLAKRVQENTRIAISN